MTKGFIKVSNKVIDLIIGQTILEDENIDRVVASGSNGLKYNYKKYLKIKRKNNLLDVIVYVRYKDRDDMDATSKRIYRDLYQILKESLNLELNYIKFMER